MAAPSQVRTQTVCCDGFAHKQHTTIFSNPASDAASRARMPTARAQTAKHLSQTVLERSCTHTKTCIHKKHMHAPAGGSSFGTIVRLGDVARAARDVSANGHTLHRCTSEYLCSCTCEVSTDVVTCMLSAWCSIASMVGVKGCRIQGVQTVSACIASGRQLRP